MTDIAAPDFPARYVTLTNPLAAYDAVIEAVGRVVARTASAQFDDATPCADWCVRDVLNHLVEVLDVYGEMAARGVQPIEGDQRVYDDPVASFPIVATAARTAFAAPGYLDTVADTPIGPQPGRVAVQHVVNEVTAHGWDLARGTGQDADLVPEITTSVLASWRAFFDRWDRSRLSFNFLEQRAAPDDAPAADQLAAYLGRAV